MRLLEQLSQKILQKSRAYYCPSDYPEQDDEFLSDEDFSQLLRNIDAFSAQFQSAHNGQQSCAD